MTPDFPLEDTFADVLRKAQRGWGITDVELCRRASLKLPAWQSLLDGHLDEAALRAVASVLHLRPLALLKLALSPGLPECGVWPDGLLRISSTYQGRMGVNAWLVWDPASKAAAVFDTGADAAAISHELTGRGLDLRDIYLTHRHGDHIGALPSLRSRHPATVHCHHRTSARDAETFDWGQSFTLGPLAIESRQTTGHTDDGTSYYIRGLSRPVAIVGDALFAGSMGGGIYRFGEALETNGRHLFSLPDATLLCPGHGPATTVGWERQNNPFAPENHHS